MSQKILKGSGDIRIIGPQASGKTTYIAALAYWPNAKPDSSPIQNIEAADLNDTENIIDMAENILLDSKPLPPTRRDRQLCYNVSIDLKPNFWLNPIASMTKKTIRMTISATDYSGELFQLLHNDPGDTEVQEYLDDCQQAAGLMIVIDATSKNKDRDYSKSLKKLQTELRMRFEQSGDNKSKYKVALVFSKAEQPRVFEYYQNNEVSEFLKDYFPKTQQVLKNWRKNWNCKITVFFCSAFGTIQDPPKANTKKDTRNEHGTKSVLAKPDFWQPFGLVEPLYWLYTGHGNIDLRKV